MTEPTGHPDSDVLADFGAGLLPGRRAAAITAHLAGCARCTALADELAGVSALLAAVPVPAMPDRVAQRLDTVLTAEVAHRTDSERARGISPRARASRPRRAGPRRARWLSPRVLAPVAAVAAAVGAGGYFLSSHGAAPQFQGASSAAAPASVAPRVTGAASGSLAVPATGAGPRSQRMSQAEFNVVVSPVDFQPGTLTEQLVSDLRVPAASRVTQAATTTVLACVHRLAGGAPLVRVERAHLQGQPVIVVVTRVSQGERAQLAGAGCSAADSHVLATATVP